MKLLAGNSNRPLADAIAAFLGLPLTNATVQRFADMEVYVEIHENVRGEDVFLIQSTSYPANDNLMELLVCRITATPVRTANPDRAPRFRPSWWPIWSPSPARTGCSRWTCTPIRSRASSTFRSTISTPRR
jgi:hypothetical protein